MRKEDCLFCKIVAGEIPSAKVYEDDRVLAFEDVNPQMPVHTLIVPKNHYDNIGDGIPDDEMGYLFNTVKKIAELKGIAESGYRVIVNTNDDAQQASSGVIDEFVSAIEAGRESVLDAEDIIKSMRVVFACLESAESGRIVEL